MITNVVTTKPVLEKITLELSVEELAYLTAAVGFETWKIYDHCDDLLNNNLRSVDTSNVHVRRDIDPIMVFDALYNALEEAARCQ